MQRGASSPLGFLLRSGSFFSPVGSTSEMGLFAGPVMTASEGAGEDCVAVRLRSAISCMAVEASILPSLYISTRAQVRGSTATHGEEKHLQEKKSRRTAPNPAWTGCGVRRSSRLSCRHRIARRQREQGMRWRTWRRCRWLQPTSMDLCLQQGVSKRLALIWHWDDFLRRLWWCACLRGCLSSKRALGNTQVCPQCPYRSSSNATHKIPARPDKSPQIVAQPEPWPRRQGTKKRLQSQGVVFNISGHI